MTDRKDCEIAYRLKYADCLMKYHGFVLKEGYFYGTDLAGNYIATSGWECNGSVAIYTLANGKWEMAWVDIEGTVFHLENLPKVNTEGKMSFVKWLEEEMGIDWNDWDENYSGQMAREIEEEYDRYYYDGLPRFAISHI